MTVSYPTASGPATSRPTASRPAASRAAASGGPADVVDRYLAAVSDLSAEPATLTALIDPDARFVEHPNLVAPSGRRRDAAAALAAREHSRRLLGRHRFDVREHIVSGDRVVTRATWTGTLAIDAGTLSAGSELSAECCMVFTVRDGRILRQENYDCYGPLETA
jgi:ketosteroid isomerase-like protein